MSVVETREPGGSDVGQEIREILMHGDHVDPRAEALLYAADRAHHVATVVRPALERGDIVVQDRYVDSSIVYQGIARGLGGFVERLSTWATNGLVPDLTVLLNTPPDEDRQGHLAFDRIEREMSDRDTIIRRGFLELAERAPDRYVVIDARAAVDEVHKQVRTSVKAAIAMGHAGGAE